ncbi:hypothetical protein [Paenibacillus abyssi]|uniref:Phospholipase/carboxylesterase/thioesterase domain-containing protein n=1 Tax=Paenibacillus abyssi TaxID=1340531 RepID=A0A917G4A7_9BACL|nr:hypothetical protein [Paenibacillus abyssi]GGG22253.1 hypothetical protein GCM10010916_43630 [Paenibacillus abyssi]
MAVTNHSFYKDTPTNVSMNYQLFLPHDFEPKKEKKYPLILFLHGVKKRGEDISLLNNYGLTWIAESKTDFLLLLLPHNAQQIQIGH